MLLVPLLSPPPPTDPAGFYLDPPTDPAVRGGQRLDGVVELILLQQDGLVLVGQLAAQLLQLPVLGREARSQLRLNTYRQTAG